MACVAAVPLLVGACGQIVLEVSAPIAINVPDVDVAIVEADAGALWAQIAQTDASHAEDKAEASLPQAEAPTFDPPPGNYTSAISVVLRSATPGARIRFTTDGSEPDAASLRYSAPIALSGRVEILAYVTASGYVDSPVVDGWYCVLCGGGMVAAPFVTPAAGTYYNDFVASLNTTTAGATICYTTDNTPPTCDSTTATCRGTSQPYDAAKGVPITWLGSTGSRRQLTLRALACKAGGINSQEAPSTIYTLSVAEPLLTASSTVPMGSRILARSITRATPTPAAQFARLHYTVDGAIPTCTTSTAIMTPPGTADPVSGSIGPITTTTTVSVIGCKEGYNPSNVVSRTYGVE